MRKSLLMLTLPNSGSTWFAARLGANLPGCIYYDKEFFNPVCNLKHEQVLRRNFGSELVSCYRNIALPGDRNIHDDIEATWGVEPYTFTKECQCAFKLPVFVQHFECFVFLRDERDTFPPGRVRVWSFYEHAWFALLEAGHRLTAVSLEDRAKEAHRILFKQIVDDAGRLGVPIIYWHELFGSMAEVDTCLRRVFPGVPESTDYLARDIITTRSRAASRAAAYL